MKLQRVMELKDFIYFINLFILFFYERKLPSIEMINVKFKGKGVKSRKEEMVQEDNRKTRIKKEIEEKRKKKIKDITMN